MDLQELKKSNCIIFECISGSKAYGLATEASDVDIRGVFIMPRDQFYSFEYQEQINDERQNIIYYELKKFLDLLAKNNPNILELLGIPEDCVLYKHPIYDNVKPENFLSRLCQETFVHYAMSQFKKARGLNKKIMNPIDKAHKNILDFCYVLNDFGSVRVLEFLKSRNLSQEKCGLVAIPHTREIFSLFYSPENIYNGIIHDEHSMEVKLSSVPKGEKPIALMFCNKDGYSKYCKEYKEYWNWVENRNAERFQNTLEHGKNYDAKNMMHLFRLLTMSEEIARSGKILVRSSNRDLLLKIRSGHFSYEELEENFKKKIEELETIYAGTTLPEKPNIKLINALLVQMRKDFYA